MKTIKIKAADFFMSIFDVDNNNTAKTIQNIALGLMSVLLIVTVLNALI